MFFNRNGTLYIFKLPTQRPVYIDTNVVCCCDMLLGLNLCVAENLMLGLLNPIAYLEKVLIADNYHIYLKK